MTKNTDPAILKLKEQHTLDELRDLAKTHNLPTKGQTKLDLATAIVEAAAKAPAPVPPASRAEALARAQDRDFLPPDETIPPPAPKPSPAAVRDAELEAKRKAAQAAEEEARDLNKPDPKAAAMATDVPEIPRAGRLKHTGRWIPCEVLQYTNVRGHKVVRKPTIFVEGHGEVDNVLDDIPPGIAHNAYQRGLLAPEMA